MSDHDIETEDGTAFEPGVSATTPPVDVVEVGRAAHALATRQGTRAHIIAEHLAAKAQDCGADDDAAFWRAVHAALRPR